MYFNMQADRPEKQHSKTRLILIILLGVSIPIIFGLISLWFGKDTNWDLQNYHYYNGYAFLQNRMGFDIAPAQMQTYFNPILDVLFYFLARSFPSSVVGFIYGSFHGLNLSLIFLLFWILSKSIKNTNKYIFAICLVIISGTGPAFLSELGNTMNDNLTSVITLLVLVLFVISSVNLNNGRDKAGYIQVGIAGLLMGLNLGLKLSISGFVVCTAICLPILYRSFRSKVVSLGIYAVTGLIGFLASNGFWMWNLWVKFGNPFFPYYNNLFQSPYAAPSQFMDLRFLPATLSEYLTWPIVISTNSRRVCELLFSDLRFGLLYAVLIVWIVYFIFGLIRSAFGSSTYQNNQYLFDTRISNFLLAFVVSAFILWMIQFSIYRYLVTLELLVPICFLLLLDRIFQRKWVIPVIMFAAIVAGTSIYAPLNWGRTSWSDPYIQVDTSQFQPGDRAVVVMLGMSPISYVIPDFPKEFRFVRPQANLMATYKYGLFDEISAVIRNTKDPIYLLYDKNDPSVDLNKGLSGLKLTLVTDTCTTLTSSLPGELALCKAIKSDNISN